MLEIPAHILKAMIDQARRQAPIEACGRQFDEWLL